MKKLIILFLVLAGLSSFAQRQKVFVKEGEIFVNGDRLAFIEKEGCKLLSQTCQFFITDEADKLLITVSMRSFADREQASPQFPDGVSVSYLVFSFKGIDATAEVDCPSMAVKEEQVAKIIARWGLIRDGELVPDAVDQLITHYGNRFSEKERRQNQPPAIQVFHE